MKFASLCSLLFVCMSVTNAFSQITSVIPLESRVRILLSEEFSYSKQVGERTVSFGETLVYTGLFKNVDNISISLSVPQNPQTITIPFSAIKKVELYQGKRNYTKRGIIIGFVAGVAAGVLASGSAASSSSVGFSNSSITFAGLGFGLLGMGVGSIIGGSIQREKWEEIPLEQFKKTSNWRTGSISFGFTIPLKR